MVKLKPLWTPYPYKAGFCITDDTDGASYENVRIVYDYLLSKSIITTKTVWAFKPEAPSGILKSDKTFNRKINSQNVTLEHKEYYDYCRQLYNSGYEIALHGASSGNNRRETTKEAFKLVNANFGKPQTIILHSKNAENLYWEEKIVHNPIGRMLLSFYSKFASLGEIEKSEYFWGDICYKHIKQIRLLRTRKLNTLKRNPSMPYFDKNKPYVKGWFSATKRSFCDCTEKTNLNKLKEENGLTVLYHYLHKYVDLKNKSVTPEFKRAAECLVNDKEIYIESTGKIMERLRLTNQIFIAFRKNFLSIINASEYDIDGYQMAFSGNVSIKETNTDCRIENDILIFKKLKRSSIILMTFDSPVKLKYRRTKRIDKNRVASFNFGHGKLIVNLSRKIIIKSGKKIEPNGFSIKWKPIFERLMTRISQRSVLKKN